MIALRVSPALLRANAAALASAASVPPHHRTAWAALARAGAGSVFLSGGERWFLNSVLRLSSLSDHQRARLNDIAVRIERGRPHG